MICYTLVVEIQDTLLLNIKIVTNIDILTGNTGLWRQDIHDLKFKAKG